MMTILGVENPQEFLGMHIPLWEAKIDELRFVPVPNANTR